MYVLVLKTLLNEGSQFWWSSGFNFHVCILSNSRIYVSLVNLGIQTSKWLKHQKMFQPFFSNNIGCLAHSNNNNKTCLWHKHIACTDIWDWYEYQNIRKVLIANRLWPKIVHWICWNLLHSTHLAHSAFIIGICFASIGLVV